MSLEFADLVQQPVHVPDPPGLVGTQTICRRLGITRETLRLRMRRGEIPEPDRPRSGIGSRHYWTEELADSFSIANPLEKWNKLVRGNAPGHWLAGRCK